MILVDIYVPSLDKSYDFQVDETVTTEKLIMEIAEMIGNEVKTAALLNGSETDFSKKITASGLWD